MMRDVVDDMDEGPVRRATRDNTVNSFHVDVLFDGLMLIVSTVPGKVRRFAFDQSLCHQLLDDLKATIEAGRFPEVSDQATRH
jgi:hypothetical protein